LKKKIQEISNKIAIDVASWLQQYGLVWPDETSFNKQREAGLRNIVRSLIGVFVKPQLGNCETIYFFEGLRNKAYMEVFDPESVVIIGSHIEKNYAKSYGYKFCWSFPIESAVHTKIYFDLDFLICRQVGIWIHKLCKHKRIIFFLYEDTRPLGTFFVHMAQALRHKATTVCIQHGYFVKSSYELRRDGLLSDINFVWDEDQIAAGDLNRSSAMVIGLPYVAVAKPTSKLKIILVGGSEKSLDTYLEIYDLLHSSLGLEVIYRPHPNEWPQELLDGKLKEMFPLLDNLNKVERLNGPRAIFIGTVSSLLYEAGVAGHIVACLKVGGRDTPLFQYNFEFNPSQVNDLAKWVSIINATPHIDFLFGEKKIRCPKQRFMEALNCAKISY